MNNFIYDELIKISNDLNLVNLSETLRQMKNINENKTCFVAFLGHFSAGKSSLINNLIGKDVLPYKTKVSTPLLTYIRYDEKEKAVIHWLDGNIENISIDEVDNVVQDNDKFDFTKLSYLEIFVNSDLLKSGLILLDTPGLNSTFERHETLLSKSLNLASKIIYVVAGARSDYDINKINEFNQLGFDVDYVRTNCDKINLDEGDSIEAWLTNDIEIFSKYNMKINYNSVLPLDSEVVLPVGIGDINIESFYVSNKNEDSRFKDIDLLRKHLLDYGANIETNLEKSSKKQLNIILERISDTIKKDLANYNDLKDKGDREIKLKLQNVEANIRTLESQIAKRNERLEQRTSEQLKELKKIADESIKSSLDRACNSIENSDVIDNQKMAVLIEKKKQEICQKTFNDLNTHISSLLKDLKADFSDIKNLDINTDCIPDFDGYDEIVINENDKLMDYKERLGLLKSQIDEIHNDITDNFSSDKFQEIKDAVDEAEKLIIEARKNNENLPPYEPKQILVSEGDTSVGDTCKKLGYLADWALLLLPGDVIAKGLGKVIAGAEKAVKVITAADKGKDTIFSIGKIVEYFNKGKATQRRIEAANKIINGVKVIKNETSLFDYLTIEHWAGKLGGLFDTPPQYELDTAYEAQYFSEKRKLMDQYNLAAELVVKKKKEAGLFVSKQQELEALEKEKQKAVEKVTLEMKKEENRIRKEAEKAALKKWRKECAEDFENKISPIYDYVGSFIEKVPNNLEAYSKERNSSLLENLNMQKKKYEEIVCKPTSDIERFIEKYNDFSDKLNSLKEEING